MANNKAAKAWYCVDCNDRVGRRIKRCPSCNGNFRSKQFKGIPKSKETRLKISEFQKGRPHPWAEGKKRPEVAKKISQSWTPEMKEAARIRGLINAENREWLIKIAQSVGGENNSNFQGKGKESLYAPGWGRKYRERIRARARGGCENCGKKQHHTLDLHHKDFSKIDHNPKNLLVVCRSCHKTLHFANSAKT